MRLRQPLAPRVRFGSKSIHQGADQIQAATLAGREAPDAKHPPILPLAVDLDGTLIRTDSLHESLLGAFKSRPREVMRWRRALSRGKAAFKREIAEQATLDPTSLPYNEELLDFLHQERRAGRRLGLFTAADQSIADDVAKHLGFFEKVQGSDGHTNLSGEAKLAAIRSAFGSQFSYAGDGSVDHPIFAAAQRVILVGSAARPGARLPSDLDIEAVFPTRKSSARVWLKALRLQHWVKNILVFVAPILGFQIASLTILSQSAILFLALGLIASATYLINDLLDLQADRQHPKKRTRPFAAGLITVRDGVAAAACILLCASGVSLLLPLAARASLGVYLLLTVCYSLALKRMPMVDVVVLAALFTIRVVAGGTLLPAPASPWLLTFSMLFFLGLAMIKRYAELERVLRADAESGRARGYTARDLPILLATGVASGMSALVIFTIYLINEQYPRQFYGNPSLLWGIIPVLLIWILRVWHLSVHGRMNEDPVVFALRDRFSQGAGFVVAMVLLAAWI